MSGASFSASIALIDEVLAALHDEHNECLHNGLGIILSDFEEFRRIGADAVDPDMVRKMIALSQRFLEKALASLFSITHNVNKFLLPLTALRVQLGKLYSRIAPDMREYYRNGVNEFAGDAAKESILAAIRKAYADLQPMRQHLNTEALAVVKLQQNLIRIEKEFIGAHSQFEPRLETVAKFVANSHIQAVADKLRAVIDELLRVREMLGKAEHWEARLDALERKSGS